jgi:hypothetical protein
VIRIHIFNPEHDVALAAHRERFTPSHACRQIRHDLGFLPAVWANSGDMVLVDDIDAAHEAYRHLGIPLKAAFIDWAMLRSLSGTLVFDGQLEICPWGWDSYLRRQLADAGIPASHLPADPVLELQRKMSHRSWAATHLLPHLRRLEGTIGESFTANNAEALAELVASHPRLVLKAPWSSSGRGIRYVMQSSPDPSPIAGLTAHVAGWATNIIAHQGSIVAEPFYDKVIDFGMEFWSDGKGRADYSGLSVFHTRNGAYTGNLLEDEESKRQRLSRYVSTALLDETSHVLCQLLGPALHGIYTGPLGIDMMVVRSAEGLLLHPCVELNLRGTMGHAALALGRLLPPSAYHWAMRITYTDKYRLQVQHAHVGEELPGDQE